MNELLNEIQQEIDNTVKSLDELKRNLIRIEITSALPECVLDRAWPMVEAKTKYILTMKKIYEIVASSDPIMPDGSRPCRDL